MTTAKLSLNKLIQDSQDYGSNDEHMVSRVFFDIEIEGTKASSAPVALAFVFLAAQTSA